MSQAAGTRINFSNLCNTQFLYHYLVYGLFIEMEFYPNMVKPLLSLFLISQIATATIA